MSGAEKQKHVIWFGFLLDISTVNHGTALKRKCAESQLYHEYHEIVFFPFGEFFHLILIKSDSRSPNAFKQASNYSCVCDKVPSKFK